MGKTRAISRRKKFVVQKHISGHDVHWDFMLESGNVLETYRLDKAPAELLDQTATATKIFDHPLRFLTYQGPVSRGRGRVLLTETGTYSRTQQEPGRVELDLNGRILKGKFILTHLEGDAWEFAAKRPRSKNATGRK